MSILVTGANGQVGTALSAALRDRYGSDHVICSDIKPPTEVAGRFVMLDILNTQRIAEVLDDYQVTEIYHLAAILSAHGEWNPPKTWNVNLNGLLSILELAVERDIKKVFFPSTIAVFGNTTPRIDTPQAVPLLPETVYGMSKASGENWCHYYALKYNLDVRCLRYPGIIGPESLAGGGTTDYAVDIFHHALQHGHYTCFLSPDTRLPMMYMEDALRATIELMEAPSEQIQLRYGYNISGCSFSPEEIASEIGKHVPDFSIDYAPDFRQEIAASWTQSIDDSTARAHWGWTPAFDLPKMTEKMISELNNRYV
ncbi:MAG: NAD-dependent epimerase/dehydratase family protein [Saprospiraceae bacterium]|nr:NAD-dependent epimerase/dehydratase family protein [Saprospiraceae bacterium]